MSTRIRSFSKINLGLAVGPVRPDGFHGLTTVYQTLNLFDMLELEATPAAKIEVTLETDHPGVPCTANGDAHRNTAVRMVTLALERLHRTARVTMRLQKRLPVQGGLGAGSANAAAALLALERELEVALPGPDRLQLAAEVGSDVPLFLLGGTVLGLERGEAVSPLPDSPSLPVVVAVPGVGVSTAQAFRDLDARMAVTAAAEQGTQELTSAAAAARLELLSRVFSSPWATTGVKRATTGITSTRSSLQDGASDWVQESHGSDLAENPLLALVHAGVENDFESVAFRQHSSLCDLKQALLGPSDRGSGALYAALSGSGSALFGIYGSPDAAHEAQQRVQALGAEALLTETLSRRAYWQYMFA